MPRPRPLPTAPRARRLGARSVASVLVLLLAACSSGGGGAGAAPAPTPVPFARAAAGDTLYAIEHFVRADRRAQFERFLTASYWPAVRRLAATDTVSARVLRQTRVLYPLRPNEDGTFSYVFLTDPVVPGESYNILEQLRRVYTPQETERRYRELTDSWAPRQFVARPFAQPAYPTDGPLAPALGAPPGGAAGTRAPEAPRESTPRDTTRRWQHVLP